MNFNIIKLFVFFLSLCFGDASELEDRVDQERQLDIEHFIESFDSSNEQVISYSKIREELGSIDLEAINQIFISAFTARNKPNAILKRQLWVTVAKENLEEAALVFSRSLSEISDVKNLSRASALMRYVDVSEKGETSESAIEHYRDVVLLAEENRMDRLLVYLNQKDPVGTLNILLEKYGARFSEDDNRTYLSDAKRAFHLIREGSGRIKTEEEMKEITRLFENLAMQDSWVLDFFIAGVVKMGAMRNSFPQITEDFAKNPDSLAGLMLQRERDVMILISKNKEVENKMLDIYETRLNEFSGVRRTGGKRSEISTKTPPNAKSLEKGGPNYLWVVVICLFVAAYFFIRK